MRAKPAAVPFSGLRTASDTGYYITTLAMKNPAAVNNFGAPEASESLVFPSSPSVIFRYDRDVLAGPHSGPAEGYKTSPYPLAP